MNIGKKLRIYINKLKMDYMYDIKCKIIIYLSLIHI